MTLLEPENSSESTTSSPGSHLLSIERDISQTSQTSVSHHVERDLTPASSIASSQEHQDVAVAGKKRMADGEFKERGHSRNLSTLSQASTGSLAELSESLKTKLNYAMIKVQNGWQNHSLKEVESLASCSPRSVRSDIQRHVMLSPRSTMTVTHETVALKRLTNEFTPASTVPSTVKGLAPPATIVPRSRRRLAPNAPLQVNTIPPNRPQVQQRTPSQNAAMEADAVETLLFMSASPSNSGRFPSNVAVSPQYSRPRYENKTKLIDRVLEDLDADGHKDLDQALSILEAHKAAKLSA